MHIVIPGSAQVYARNNAPTVNVAIDDVKEEVERQLRREKKLHIRMYRRGGAWAKRVLRLDN
jgi:ribosome-associated translation inhibitor RaiA